MQTEPTERGRMLTSISNGILALHREHYGRGADRARTIAHGDYLVTFLHDIFTPGERTLVEAGKFAQVRDMRTAWQDADATAVHQGRRGGDRA